MYMHHSKHFDRIICDKIGLIWRAAPDFDSCQATVQSIDDSKEILIQSFVYSLTMTIAAIPQLGFG
jgi:hypothetical protein